VDPDAPTPQQPNISQIRHFVGGGFRLAGVPTFNTTPAISDFVQPSPPTNSDSHRYILLLWHQPADFPTSIDPSIEDFNVTAFAEQVGLGEPIAGNFFTVSTQPDAVITDP
ncbi:PEBP-like protein, partial [Punctularia strigosozonata HHB-11173 SS5]|uniref:PEBP-like protein n=1 Tax=Punctularia strigosozonata (strain HHB-11173) TaxID=741275 RepID=UPI0004417230